MSSLISSRKRDGAGPLGSFDNSIDPIKFSRRCNIARSFKTALALLSFFFVQISSGMSADNEKPVFIASKSAAQKCISKQKALEKFASKSKPGQRLRTQFFEDEINSYLALNLSPNYHPCLKSLIVTFEWDKVHAVALLDFDRLESTSAGFLPKIIGLILSGTHTISASGQLVSNNGSAYYRLEQARLDNSTLPKSLVKEVISFVGSKQNPPWDPLQPSKLPDKIEKVRVFPGYIIAYQ
jgi:hypothetical protein